MNNYDINDYLPSILNPRFVKKEHADLSLTQNSIASRCSLSLKRKNGLATVNKTFNKTFPFDKENRNNNRLGINNNNNKNIGKCNVQEKILNTSTLQTLQEVKNDEFLAPLEKENSKNLINITCCNNRQSSKNSEAPSIGCSAIEDLPAEKNNENSSPFSFEDIEIEPIQSNTKQPVQSNSKQLSNSESLISVSSATELDEHLLEVSQSTEAYEVTEQPIPSVSFGVKNCDTVNVSTKNSSIMNIVVTQNHDISGMDIDCEVIENSHISIESDHDETDHDDGPSPPKKSSIAINLEIKKNKTTETLTEAENSKVLILNTDNIERLSHVIVQPPNYKLVKRKFSDRSKFKNNFNRNRRSVGNGKTAGSVGLKQKTIDCYFSKEGKVSKVSDRVVASFEDEVVVSDDDEDMSKNLNVADAAKCDRSGRQTKSIRREGPVSAIKAKSKNVESPKQHSIRNSTSEAPRAPSRRNGSASSATSPKRNVESSQFCLSAKSTTKSLKPKPVPPYKIIAGTRFAVDAFSYGDIPNVRHYFLTHFHSDHYSGLKKGFNKMLYCTKITADLCVSRLGVNPKYINILSCDETHMIDGVEVTAVDANHCPGAVMLVFTLPTGRTVLHTGDFRASPQMESYPVFWNKEIHTVYLDSTYCNPRYDFPTQEQSLEMALYILRQKKLALEKVGKNFASVLIVCGTYTIGKEKFFMGLARRVGCVVWACPEKDKVLQAVEGRSFCTAPPAACQLHVVPMRDLTHEKLRSYLDSLQPHFSEVVAFKPSGWENGKNSTVEKDLVTIHGIPYSEHSSFSEMIRFVKFLKPEQVIPTVDISGGVKAVQKYLPCPLVSRDTSASQSRVSDYFSIHNRTQEPAVT